MTVKSLLVGLVLSVVVAFSVDEPGARPSESHFEAPGLVSVVPRGVQGVARDLTRSGGRMRAVRSLDVVFAWLPNASALVANDPKGDVELLLGQRDGPGFTLAIGKETLSLERRVTGRDLIQATLPRPDGDSLGLIRDGEGLALTADGEVVRRLGADPLAEAGLVSIGLGKGASLRGFSVTPEQGEPREIGLSGDESDL
ncbi:MAG: hypothetical protein ACI9EF_003893, partial [Pseudohongiellaceae bacterium]